MKQQARGASVKKTRTTKIVVNPLVKFILLWSVFLSVVGITIYMGVSSLLAKPIARVAVTGEFHHVSRQTVAELVQPFLQQGFVQLSLQQVKDELKKQPWIFDVTISRVWPDEISIDVIEQKPIARWAKVGYLNHRGELFEPNEVIRMDQLPLLSGPEGTTERVMIHFQQLKEVLQQQKLTLEALNLDKYGNWIATLDNQSNIVLGSSQVMEKIRRFVKTYKMVLNKEFERIERIDMRYSNGLAVAWRNISFKKNQKKG